MKKMILLSALAISSFSFGAEFPAMYCVSTQPYQNVNQINVFTNAKGTMRINLQFWATDGQESGSFDTKTLETIRGLKYNDITGVMSNTVDKVAFQLDSQPMSPKAAQKMFGEIKATYDLENPPGHKIAFKKYYKGQMLRYNLNGPKSKWTSSLHDAFKAGVTNYVCGLIQDSKGRIPTIFDLAGSDD